MNIWQEFGFANNLYDTHPIPASEQGVRLLVGRKAELMTLKNRIRSFDQHTTLEGPNGVGKTSLVFVAGYQLFEDFLRGDGPAIIPVEEPFQISSTDRSLSFRRELYLRIAQMFLDREFVLSTKCGLKRNLSDLRDWLSTPVFRTKVVTFGPIGGSGGKTATESAGFDEHGFFELVDSLLRETFPKGCGFLCAIDNLEILNTSRRARETLEAMRDTVLARQGLKWVICGARGMVRSVASTPRLQGRLLEPLEVNPLAADAIPDLVRTRVSEYTASTLAVPPVSDRGFVHVFRILNKNLRDSLKFCSDFSLWMYENGKIDRNPDNYYGLLEAWLTDICERYTNQAGSIPPRAWRLFDEICMLGGSISPSDFEEFGFNSSQAMRGQMARLEEYDLVSTQIDETDNRRKTIAITSKGWLIRYQRCDFQYPS